MLSCTLQVHILPRHGPGARWEHLIMISRLHFAIKIKCIWLALPKRTSSFFLPCSSHAKPVGCILHVPFTLHICVAQLRKEPVTRSSGPSGSGTWLTAFTITVTDACEVNPGCRPGHLKKTVLFQANLLTFNVLGGKKKPNYSANSSDVYVRQRTISRLGGLFIS